MDSAAPPAGPAQEQSRVEPRPASQPAGQCASVAILMCTRNGAEFLQEQLDSIRTQTHQNWRLFVSDDHSVDETRAMLTRYQASFLPDNRVEIRDGPGRGSTANFMSLATDASIEADYFAFCDQDDIWLANKLERALAWLKPIPSQTPAMYGSRTRAISSAGMPLHLSPYFRKPPQFRNALVQNVAGGNTIVMNKAARALPVKAGMLQVVSHDWWMYQLVSGAGGVVLYDPVAFVEYRQHRNNQIGANQGFRASMRRLRSLMRNQFVAWNDVNAAALKQCEHLLTPENQRLLATFSTMRKSGLWARIKLWRQTHLYRQTKLGHLALLLALLTKKL